MLFEDGKAKDAAIEDMIGKAGFGDARRSRHDKEGNKWRSGRQENHPDTFFYPFSTIKGAIVG